MLKKEDSVKIIQISVTANDHDGLYVIGLGDDGLVYAWRYAEGHWILNKKIDVPGQQLA